MAYVMKELSGSLFRKDKEGNESRPDYGGDAMIDGVGYWVSAWIKINKNGGKFMSLAFKPKGEPKKQGAATDGGAAFIDDQDIPF